MKPKKKLDAQSDITKKRINYNNYHFSSSIVLYISHTFICEKCVFLPNILRIGNVFYNMCLYALHAMHYKEQMLIIPPYVFIYYLSWVLKCYLWIAITYLFAHFSHRLELVLARFSVRVSTCYTQINRPAIVIKVSFLTTNKRLNGDKWHPLKLSSCPSKHTVNWSIF